MPDPPRQQEENNKSRSTYHRYNPHGARVAGEEVTSCWGNNPRRVSLRECSRIVPASVLYNLYERFCCKWGPDACSNAVHFDNVLHPQIRWPRGQGTAWPLPNRHATGLWHCQILAWECVNVTCIMWTRGRRRPAWIASGSRRDIGRPSLKIDVANLRARIDKDLLRFGGIRSPTALRCFVHWRNL